MTTWKLAPRPDGFYDGFCNEAEPCGHPCEIYFVTQGECDCAVYGAYRAPSVETDLNYLMDADAHATRGLYSLRSEVLIVAIDETMEAMKTA